MKKIIILLFLVTTACQVKGLSAPTLTPMSTQTLTSTATVTLTATLTSTATPTRKPTRTATPSPTEMPTFKEGEVFPAGDLELRVTTQRAKLVWYPDEILSIDCQRNPIRICLVVKVQVVSGSVTSEKMFDWRMDVNDATDTEGVAVSNFPKMIFKKPDGNASYGYWVLFIEPSAGDLYLHVLETRILAKDSPIVDAITLV